jgi:hypothetical protein
MGLALPKGVNLDGYRLLGLAILKIAMRDAARGDVEARRWLLFSPMCGLILDVVGWDRRHIRAMVLGM